jgi:DNA-binding GntR family transcriptional regulator
MNPKLRLSAEDAYHHLRNAITTGKILPGKRVITQQIATELRISRIPIKEA